MMELHVAWALARDRGDGQGPRVVSMPIEAIVAHTYEQGDDVEPMGKRAGSSGVNL